MIKKIDKYIIRKFIGTFVFAIVLIITIVIVFDISEKIDDFMERSAPLKEIIFVYYLNFIPYFVNLFSPLFTFIAVIFFTSKMAANTEIIAILSSGVSFRRIMRPYIISAIIIGMFSYYLTNFLIPPTNQVRLDFEAKYIRKRHKDGDYNIHKQVEPQKYIFLNAYDANIHEGYELDYTIYSNEGMVYNLSANVIHWDSIRKIWKMQDLHIRKINGFKEQIKHIASLDTSLNFKPEDLDKKVNNMDAMNYFQLNSFIKKEELRGSESVIYFQVEKHKRAANPFSTVILSIIGFSLASRKVRGGIGMHIGLGLILSFSYILFMQITTTFATNGNLPPMVAVWIPNICFGIISIFLVRNAPK